VQWGIAYIIGIGFIFVEFIDRHLT